jgi:MFS family permease
MNASVIPKEPDEAEFPEPPGGGLALALTGGLATAGAVFLIWAPLLVFVWLAVASILTGASVRQGRHVFTVTIAAVVLPLVASFVATCLTGMWGWLVIGIFVYAVLLAIATPVGFAIGRLLRPRLTRRFTIIRAILLVTGFLAAVGWGIVIGNAILPASCPAPTQES